MTNNYKNYPNPSWKTLTPNEVRGKIIRHSYTIRKMVERDGQRDGKEEKRTKIIK